MWWYLVLGLAGLLAIANAFFWIGYILKMLHDHDQLMRAEEKKH